MLRDIIFTCALTSLVAHAETFLVTSLADSGTGSLREAISLANATPLEDTIRFAPGFTGTITLSSTLTSSAPIRIEGFEGSQAITISGNDNVRVFRFNRGPSHLSHLTIQNGRTTLGGANIRAFGDLELISCRILNGQATALSGTNNNSQNADGGGIFHSGGNLLIDSCVIQGNSTIGGFSQGGGLYTQLGTVTIRRSRIIENTTNGTVAEGGGIGSRSTMTIENSEIADNETLASSSGGGGIYTDTDITLTQCTISSNVVGATTGIGGYSVGGAFASVGGDATFVSCTITANSAPPGMGQGAGISSLSGGVLSFENCIVAGNLGADLDTIPGRSVLYRDNRSNIFGRVENTVLNTLSNRDSSSQYAVSDPRLSALDFHGGMTRSHVPLLNSPVLDASLSILSHSIDQRGANYPRLSGDAPDIGAIERQTLQDSDNDGLPDAIESLIPDLATSDGDLDNDGVSDLLEYSFLGTAAIADPAIFPNSSIRLSPGFSTSVDFSPSPAREYRLLTSDDLISPFVPLENDFIRFLDSSSASFETPTLTSQRFFRVEARVIAEP